MGELSIARPIFHSDVINLHEGRCARCTRSAAFDDIVLQVNHKFHVSGRKPWEYDNRIEDALITTLKNNPRIGNSPVFLIAVIANVSTISGQIGSLGIYSEVERWSGNDKSDCQNCAVPRALVAVQSGPVTALSAPASP
jgi:hypothetical protein